MNKLEARNRILVALAAATCMLSLSGCLVTRGEVHEGKNNEPSPAQQKSAADEVRFQEIDEQMRALTGRVETVENGVNILGADKNGVRREHETEQKGLKDRLTIYEEELAKLQTQYLAMAQQVEALRQAYDSALAPKKETAATGKGAGGAKGSFEAAEVDYGKKHWKEAIVSYEKYRSANPSGKKYAEATFKIGASFHELGMKSEAKTFYQEVADKFPKNEWAKKAQQRIKTLK